MALDIEKVNKDTVYAKLFEFLKKEFKEGKVFDGEMVLKSYLEKYPEENSEEMKKLFSKEYSRIICDLMSCSELEMLPNGQYSLKLRKDSEDVKKREEEEDR